MTFQKKQNYGDYKKVTGYYGLGMGRGLHAQSTELWKYCVRYFKNGFMSLYPQKCVPLMNEHKGKL